MLTRRAFLGSASAAALVALAGCQRAVDDAAPSTSGTTDGVPSTTDASTITDASMTTDVPASAGDAAWAAADFTELDTLLAATSTEAFRLVERGALVHEWYRTDPSYRRDIASAQKSVLSLLVGRAIADGAFSVDTPIDDLLGTEWTPHGRSAGITVRQLLTMTSGLDDRYDVIAEPGTAWRYSGAFASLFDVLTTTSGLDLNELADDWLFTPAGAATAQFRQRRTNAFAPVGLVASATDLTAIGEAVLASPPVVAADWLGESWTATQPFNESYGHLWWLNGEPSFMLPGPAPTPLPGPLIPTAPADTVAALGKDDQKLYVTPSLGLVMARLGGKAAQRTEAALSSFDARLWETVLRQRA